MPNIVANTAYKHHTYSLDRDQDSPLLNFMPEPTQIAVPSCVPQCT